MRHQIKLILLTLLLLASSDSVWAQFAFITNADNTITITGYTGSDLSAIVPGTTNGLPVTDIGYGAFLFADVTNILIPNSVTNVEERAFDSCHHLIGIAIPDSVLNVGVSAFIGCDQLTSIKIPSHLTGISDGLFVFCSALTSVIIPDGVTNIGDSAFLNCSGLTNITIPQSVTSIENFAFSGCTSMTGIVLPTNIVRLSDDIFYQWNGMTSMIIPTNITQIGNYAFGLSRSLSSIDIPESVTNIGDGAFGYDSGLTNITIHGSVNRIGQGAFSYCYDNLKSVVFYGDAPTSVGQYMFDGSYNVVVYYLPDTAGWGTNFAGVPAFIWLPQIQTAGVASGALTNQFAFNINWANGHTVVVEASTDLVNWQPVQTNTLTTGSDNFNDPQWTNFQNRFYRARSP
jgi:hypothetical protein